MIFLLVLFANVFSSVLAFCGSVIYIHLLVKSAFGIYSFASNILALILLFNGGGSASALLQYISTTNAVEREQYLYYAWIFGFSSNILLGIIMVLYAQIAPLPFSAVKLLIISMSLLPVGRLYTDIAQAYLRAIGLNTLQAKFLFVNNVSILCFSVVGACYYGTFGIIYGTYFAYCIIWFIGSQTKLLPPIKLFVAIDIADAYRFICYAVKMCVINSSSTLLFISDSIIISYITHDAVQIANYRIASILPFALNLIPNMAVNFYYAQFAQNAHIPLVISNLVRTIRVRMLFFSGIVSIILVLYSAEIINTIFGKQYQDSILPMQILGGSFWFMASFRVINTNVLSAIGKSTSNLLLSLLTLLINLLLTYYLTRYKGIIGSAIAMSLTYIFASCGGMYCMMRR